MKFLLFPKGLFFHWSLAKRPLARLPHLENGTRTTIMELRLEPFDPRRGQSSPIFISLAPLADGSLYEIKNLDVKLVKP